MEPSYRASVDKRIPKAISMLEKALTNDYKVVMLSDCDPDGLSALKMMVSTMRKMGFPYRTGYKPTAGGIVHQMQPKNKQNLSYDEYKDLKRKEPDLIVSLDLPMSGRYMQRIANLRECFDADIISISHHRTRRRDSTIRLKKFIDINSNDPYYPTSKLVYDLCGQTRVGNTRYNLQWALVGILGDKATESEFWEPMRLEFVKKFGEDELEAVNDLKDALELVGYAKKDVGPLLSEAVISALTPSRILNEQCANSSVIMSVYGELYEERQKHIEDVLGAVHEVTNNLVVRQIVSPFNICTPVINEVSVAHPDVNFWLYQEVPNDKTGEVFYKNYFRRSNAHKLNDPRVNMRRIARISTNGVQGSEFSGKAPNGNAKVPRDGFEKFKKRVLGQFKKIKDVRQT